MSFKTVCWLFITYATTNAEIPEYINICKRNDPNLTQCITNSIELLRPKLVEGIPELDIPAIEPLYLPELVFSRGGAFKALGTNIVVRGASDFKIIDLDVDVDNMVYKANLHFPKISFDAIYEVDAKILAMPLKGKGPVQANATDIEGKAIIKGHKETENGRTFVLFDELSLKLKMKNYQIRLENLFNGDKNLGEAVNLALNDNKRDLMNMFRPLAEDMAASVLLARANQVTKHFNYEELFPLDVDVDNMVYKANLHFPKISFDAIYEVDAKILAMPLKGKGPVQANATDIEGKAIIKGHKETENGRTFVLFDELSLKLKMKNYQIRLENLFNGDKNLGEAVNLALNDNKRDLMNMFRPLAEDMAASVLLARANQVTKHFNYEELFPLE